MIDDVWDNTDPDNLEPINDGDTTKDKTPVIGGEGEPGNTIIVIIDDEVVGSTIVGEDGKWTFEPEDELTDGEHKFEVIERDPEGNESEPSDPVTVIVDPSDGGEQPQKPAKPTIEDIWDNTDPDNLVPIGDGDSTKDNTPVIGGEGTPGNTIIVIIDDEVVGTAIVDEDGKWTFEPEEPLSEGEHKFEVIERDPEGNESDPSDPVSVIVDPDHVRPVITAVIDNVGDSQGPLNPGETTDDAQPEIHGTAKPGSVVEIYDGETLLGSTTANEFGDWMFQPATPLANGPHNLTAVATDPLGRETTSDPFGFAVDIFGFGLIYGIEDFTKFAPGGYVWGDGETVDTGLLNITDAGGGSSVAIWMAGTGGTHSLQMTNTSGLADHQMVNIDLKGKTAGALSLEYGWSGSSSTATATIEFYDAAGNKIHTHTIVGGAGEISIPMPDGLQYASFSISLSRGDQFLISSMLMSDGLVPIEDFTKFAPEGYVWGEDETVDTGLLNITNVFGGSSVSIWRGGIGSHALRLNNARSPMDNEIAKFDLKGKVAGALSLEFGWGGAGNLNASATIDFYDAAGDKIHSAVLKGIGEMMISMPEGLQYSSFSISLSGMSDFFINTMTMGTPSEWPTSTNGLESDVNDLASLDGLGGDVFFVNEGEEDAIEFAGTDGTDMLKLTGEGQTLDLSNLQGKLASIEAIDLTGTGANTLKLSLGDVLEQGGQGLFIKNDTTQMLVRGGEGDKVELSDLLPDGTDVGDWAQMAGTVTLEGVSYNVFYHSGL
ncbi:Ig-like domain-containing protein, partial [Burkholderia ubonensis]|uniref:Ig-like domain-containing protein n=1 Tax=Burkholderia ubonensis TaxID=101571 RepID=UPI001E35E326